MSYELFLFVEIILTFKSVFAENAHIGIEIGSRPYGLKFAMGISLFIVLRRVS